MKVVSIVLVVVGVASILLGAYITVTGGRPGKPSSSVEPAQTVTPQALEDLKALTERFNKFEGKVRDLETIIGKLYTEVSALKNSLETKPAKPPEQQPTPPQGEGSSTNTPREQVGTTKEERDKQKSERMFDEMLHRFTDFTQRRIERLADRRGWNEQKRQSVSAIMGEHQEEVKKLIEATRQAGTVEPGMRDTISEKIRNISLGTMEKLRAVLTPDEMQEVQRVLEPPRRVREPVPETPGPGPGETTPPEPGPGG
jgi:chromosome segregation ATPase